MTPEQLRTAKKPEDVFGPLADAAALAHVFREWVKAIHPDRHPDLKDAGALMPRLVELRMLAEGHLKDGTYGKPRAPKVDAVLKSTKRSYQVTELYQAGEVADLFRAGEHLLKITRKPSDNDLLDVEADILGKLNRSPEPKAAIFRKYLPDLVDRFSLIEKGVHRRVNVLSLALPEAEFVRRHQEKQGFAPNLRYYSLAEIHAAYPNGIDARDAAWMIRRVFEGLGWVHSLGYVHGAILPEHVLVHPLEHGARLVGWSYATRAGTRLHAISSKYKHWYTDRRASLKDPVAPKLDVQLTARCAMLLMDGKAPPEINAFFSACVSGKVTDGWDAYRRFDEALKIFGPRTYRAFEMPKGAGT